MSKVYDFALDMNSKNSNSVILNNIQPNSTILEIGCAHGRMTKYLKEQLSCTVDIVEQDEEAGRIAKQWARNYSFADVETNFCDLKQPNCSPSIFDHLYHLWEIDYHSYDYVIFADVLEHLKNPNYILMESQKMLNKNGSIWISIPNVAYNGVIVDLINNKFTYRETGLLDQTHLRFFTYPSLEKMVKECGLNIAAQHNLINLIKFSEFRNAYVEVPPQIVSFLRLRPLGEVYQFVWELKNV